MEKIIVWVRNLTKDKDMAIELPMEEEKLDKILNPNDEYIIIDSDIFDIGEYESIDELNKFLFDCKENGISLADLEILSKILCYKEVIKTVDNGNYVIVDFNGETLGWNYGRGGDITNDYDKGLCVYESGYYNPFNFEMTEDIHCWIDWESVWVNANVHGWQIVTIDDNGYLVHR